MKRKILLDSFALLAYLNKEKGFQKVQKMLSDAHKGYRISYSGDISELMHIIHPNNVT